MNITKSSLDVRARSNFPYISDGSGLKADMMPDLGPMFNYFSTTWRSLGARELSCGRGRCFGRWADGFVDTLELKGRKYTVTEIHHMVDK